MPDETESHMKRAHIHVLDDKDESIDVIPFRFNPTEYSLSKNVQYGDQQLAGTTTPVTQFVSGDAETLSMELFFDTSEAGTDVRKEHTNRLDDLLTIEDGRYAPRHCRFVWGSLVFKAVLQSAEKQFTMFLSDGTPVRARVNVTFKGYSKPAKGGGGGGGGGGEDGSEDQRTVRTVKEGDTLWEISDQEYGNPRKWRKIANENGIENPRELQIGTELVIPPQDA